MPISHRGTFTHDPEPKKSRAKLFLGLPELDGASASCRTMGCFLPALGSNLPLPHFEIVPHHQHLHPGHHHKATGCQHFHAHSRAHSHQHDRGVLWEYQAGRL